MRTWTRSVLVACVLASTVAADRSSELEAPIRLEAGDAIIETGAHVGHAGPLFADYDGDGLPDLLVGNLLGYIQLYRNVGTKKAPKFEDKGLLEVDGTPVRINNW
ncbi:MAG: FG-GAP repeat domain-containing protein [Planctomycetota bacterium]|jgi:hypothetical protein